MTLPAKGSQAKCDMVVTAEEKELKKLVKFTDEELITFFAKQDASYRPPHPLPRGEYWDEHAQPIGGDIPGHCDPRTRPYWIWITNSDVITNKRNDMVATAEEEELKKLVKLTDEELPAYFNKQDATYRPPHPLPRQQFWDECAQPIGGDIPGHCDPRTRPYWIWTMNKEVSIKK